MRPRKEYRIRKNGDSIQLLENGVYVGSISLKTLCHLIKRSDTTVQLAQKTPSQPNPKKGSYDTKEELDSLALGL